MDCPDYYEILGLQFDPPPTSEQVKTAYKKRSLLTHPDRRTNLTPAEKQKVTQEFQKVADAYSVLIDPSKRQRYDEHYRKRSPQSGAYPFDPMEFFKSFVSGSGHANGTSSSGRPDPHETFAGVFEDMMKPEVERTIPLWKYLGTASGATIGFILGSLPGLAIGSIAGNRLGAVRDAKGKSVYAVFSQLEGSQKATILKGLAMKVLGHGLS